MNINKLIKNKFGETKEWKIYSEMKYNFDLNFKGIKKKTAHTVKIK